MSKSPKCCAILPGQLSFHTVSCKNTGSLEHEGKNYCKIHHPPTLKAKREARNQAWKERLERESLARQRTYHEASEAARKAAEYDTLMALNAELVEALKLCSAVCAGETLNKSSLIRALDKSRAALAKAAQSQTELPK